MLPTALDLYIIMLLAYRYNARRLRMYPQGFTEVKSGQVLPACSDSVVCGTIWRSTTEMRNVVNSLLWLTIGFRVSILSILYVWNLSNNKYLTINLEITEIDCYCYISFVIISNIFACVCAYKIISIFPLSLSLSHRRVHLYTQTPFPSLKVRVPFGR